MFPDLRVFISFAETDRQIAERVAHALQRLGIEPYLLGEQSALHTDLAIESRNAIESSYAFLLLASSSSGRSDAVKEDFEFALGQAYITIALVGIDHTSSFDDLQQMTWAEPWPGLGKRTFYSVEYGLEKLESIASSLYDLRPVKWTEPSEPVVQFSPELTPKQIRGVLEALSTYWRNCGGIGLSVDFHFEEAEIAEPVNV